MEQEKKNKKKIFIIVTVVILLIVIGIATMFIMKKDIRKEVYAGKETTQAVSDSDLSQEEITLYNMAINRTDDNLLNGKTVETIIKEEKERQENKIRQEELEIKEKEKQYSENSKYQCFKDEKFKIRFYYDTEKLQYASSIAQGGKLALQERNTNNMLLYSTNELGNDDKNQIVQNFLSGQVQDGFTILENKDITISKIKPVEVRYIECQKGNVLIRNYWLFKDNLVCNFSIGATIGIETITLNEILDTIISE